MKVSVIIPTHNRANLISRAVDSVLNQTYRDLEVIVVSDGSTDETDDIMKAICDKDNRVNYISYSKAKGGNVARNIGIKAAKYDYIAFLDDDDEWLPLKLEKQMMKFKKNIDVGLVYTSVNIIYENEDIEYKSRTNKSGDLSREILLSNCIGTTSTVVIKKNILESTGLFDTSLKARQDYDLWIRVCQICQVDVVNEPCINYYNFINNNQISSQTQKYIDASKYIFNKYESLYKNLGTETMNLIKYNICILIAEKELRNGNKYNARKQLIGSLKYYKNIKSIILYLISFTNYKTILKLRSAIK